MLDSIWQDVQRQFRFGNKVTQIILINICIWIIANILLLIQRGIQGSSFATSTLQFFEFSTDYWHNLIHPWSIITYAFLHVGMGHLFWNMILFYWFGRIVGDLIGNRKILPLYLWSAIAGGLLFWITDLIIPYGAPGTKYILGASAGVMGTVLASAVVAPEYEFRLIIIGDVKLKFIVLAIVLIDIFAFGTDGNTGGHLAHIGGMIMGYIFVQQLQNGNDLSTPINRIVDGIGNFFGTRSDKDTSISRKFGRSTNKEVKTEAKQNRDKQARIDEILDRINKNGIDSISKEDREFLSKAGNAQN